MQNTKCIMQNDGMPYGVKIIPEGHTSILHFASCILHLCPHVD